MHKRTKKTLLPPLLALLALAGGCGGGDSDPKSDPQGPIDEPDTEISEHHRMLNTLGVDVDTALAEPARDKDGNPLPEDYAPLKQKTMTLGVPRRELFIAGPEIDGKRVNLYDDGAFTGPDNKDKTPYAALANFQGENAWAIGTEKVSTRGDVDGDGFEEVIIFWRDAKGNWNLKVIDDQKDQFKVYDHTSQTFGSGDITWPDVAAADVDGDGRDEVIFAGRDGKVSILDDKENSFSLLKEIDYNSTGFSTNANNYLRVAAGDLTGDDRAEIVVVVSRVKDLRSSSYDASKRGQANYYVYADAGRDFTRLATGGDISTDKVEFKDNSDQLHAAAMADVAIGDVTGDGRNEIVIAGIERGNEGAFNNTGFNPDSDSLYDQKTGYNAYMQAQFIAAVLAYDNVKNQVSSLKVQAYNEAAPLTKAHCNSNDGCIHYVPRIETVDVNTLTIGDTKKQRIAVNSRILDGSDLSKTLYSLPAEKFYPTIGFTNVVKQEHATSRSSGMVTVGDVTGNGNEEIIFVDQYDDPQAAGAQGRLAVRVYGLDDGGKFKELKSFNPETVKEWKWDVAIDPAEMTGFGASAVTHYFPIIQPVNVDEDTAVVQWIKGAHRVEFTQPRVIAAMAAAPCNPDWGQVGCNTSLSNAMMTSEGSDTSITSTSSVTVGVSLEDRTFTQAELELTATVEGSLNMTAYNSASIEHAISYQGGNGEDSVIFTTMPVDYYGYKVVSSATEDKAQGDQELFVGIPREPITRVVSREFYNATVGDSAFQIDDAVFSHTVGDVGSYPSKSAMESMVKDTNGLLSLDATVGQSGQDGGGTGVSVKSEKTDGRSTGAGLAIGGELRVVAGSFLVGASTTVEVTGNNWLEITDSTTYAGYVASITSGQVLYNFGLAVYPQTYTDPQTNREQKFQVLNYWVGKD